MAMTRGVRIDAAPLSSAALGEMLPAAQPGTRPAHIHLVGIGGAGLSAIACVLLERGYQVTGSDLAAGAAAQVRDRGARVYVGHRREHVTGADLVLVSSAVPSDNPEIQAARALGIPVVKRAEFLGWLTAGRATIAVAGTHGKTTTTAMIALLLTLAGRDPSYIIGGVLPNLQGNAHAGAGQHFVIEADEYDRTFLGLRPTIAVITTVEWDHVDCYPEPQDCCNAFMEFASGIHDDGVLVACNDDAVVRSISDAHEKRGRAVLRYGLAQAGDWQANSVRPNTVGGSDFVAVRRGEALGSVSLRIPGHHNVANALAALAVADQVGVSFAEAASALGAYSGVGRRFELKGEVAGISIVDDYAHHPTEVRATLAAARQRFPGRAIWAVFQPHTFSRTKALLDDLGMAFADADHVIVTDIYAARERDTLGMASVQLVDRMRHADARYIGGLRDTADFLIQYLRPGDVLITMGAGDDYRVGESVLASLGKRVHGDERLSADR
jgi:UDP-N-acetylmuramate--alanine ligase